MTRAVAPPPPAPPSPIPTHAELRLTLELERGSDSALLRVISILHRRRCRVLHASFAHGDTPADELQLHILAPTLYAGGVEHWLRGLVDVRCAVALPSD